MHEQTTPKIEKLSAAELHIPIPDAGGASLVFARNAEDYRGKPNQEAEIDARGSETKIGELMPSAREQAYKSGRDLIANLIDTMNPEEVSELKIAVVASDSKLGKLATDSEFDAENPPQRCVETAEQLAQGINDVLDERGLNRRQFFNNYGANADSEGTKAITLHKIQDLEIREGTFDYFAFLEEKARELQAAGEEVNVWALYEKDTYKDKREELGAEGPEDIAGRMFTYIKRIKQVAEWYHRTRSSSDDKNRLVVISIVPQDIMGPFINLASGLPAQGHEIPRTENLAGFSVSLSSEGELTLEAAGTEHPLPEEIFT